MKDNKDNGSVDQLTHGVVLTLTSKDKKGFAPQDPQA